MSARTPMAGGRPRPLAQRPSAPAALPRRLLAIAVGAWLAIAVTALVAVATWPTQASAAAAAAAAAAADAATELPGRAAALRAQLATPAAAGDPLSPPRRQLLASLERRIDLARSRTDIAALAAAAAADAGSPPRTLLALDDQRRALQDADAALAGGERRLALLRQERVAAGERLLARVAALRGARDPAGSGDDAIAAELQARLAESTIAELDLLIDVVAAQQALAGDERARIAQRLAAAPRRLPVAAGDDAAIAARLAQGRERWTARLQHAVDGRDAAASALQALAADATPMQRQLRRETLASRDLEIEIARDALTNLELEAQAWQLALRFHRDGEAAALVEARRQGPAVRASLQRKRDFFADLSAQALARLGAFGLAEGDDAAAGTGAAAAADAADRRALREVFARRLRSLQSAQLDQQRLLALLDRLRSDFDAAAAGAGTGDRLALWLATLRQAAEDAWRHELFTVDQAVDIDGRRTEVPRAVTVGKVVKAPLLLVIGLWLAFRATGWAQGWLQRRRGIDADRARMFVRWSRSLLVCAVVLLSLVAAGIPLAAFAFVGGAVAIGAGFGMQTLFKNLISGVLVLLERPFRLGDEIEIGGLRGTVVDIDLRTSVLRDSDGGETLIPNSLLIEQNLKNMTFRDRTQRQALTLVVDAATDPRAAFALLRDAAQRHGLVRATPEPEVFLDQADGDGLRLRLHYWLDLVPGTNRRRVASDLRLMVLGAFAEAGIRFPEPPVIRLNATKTG